MLPLQKRRRWQPPSHHHHHDDESWHSTNHGNNILCYSIFTWSRCWCFRVMMTIMMLILLHLNNKALIGTAVDSFVIRYGSSCCYYTKIRRFSVLTNLVKRSHVLNRRIDVLEITRLSQSSSSTFMYPERQRQQQPQPEKKPQSPSPTSNFDSTKKSDRFVINKSTNDNRDTIKGSRNSPIGENRKRKHQQQQQQVRMPPCHAAAAEQTERQLSLALDSMKSSLSPMMITKKNSNNSNHSSVQVVFLFPTIRECNAALATFGDAGDLLRALRMFGKMRKASLLLLPMITQKNQQQQPTINTASSRHQNQLWPTVPTPTLVTYSTLMSRAAKLNKPVVALRLWNLMIAGRKHDLIQLLQIDVKAANILMNCYAKLADVESAQRLLDDMKFMERGNSDSSNVHNHTRVPPMMKKRTNSKIQLPAPNLVTYNTYLSACHKAGDLDSAVTAFREMPKEIIPDERTYTTLIATVARKSSTTAGRNDPSLAFSLLHEMIHDRNLRPNGMTYSALIDVCGRCNRSDLALQGLRMMLRQKALENKVDLIQQQDDDSNTYGKELHPQRKFVDKRVSATTDADDESKTLSAKKYSKLLPNEVGAWTAAINACGKAGRVDTAITLFYAMSSKFSVQPNVITCGCLTNTLLLAGRTGDTIDVLRYMKRHNIVPSEVMYTSLMSRAGKLVQIEQQRQRRHPQQQHPDQKRNHHVLQKDDDDSTMSVQDAKAIEVYTELIKSLSSSNVKESNLYDRKDEKPGWTKQQYPLSSQNSGEKQQQQDDRLLLQTFLVFQEMKAVGAYPDLACFNSLLSACARSGDNRRAQFVLQKMQEADIDPNDTSWRLLMRCAASATHTGHMSEGNTNTNHVESVWKQALSYQRIRLRRKQRQTVVVENDPYGSMSPSSMMWKPSIESFLALLTSYMREADSLYTTSSSTGKSSSTNRGADGEKKSVGKDNVSLLTGKYYELVIQSYEDVLMSRNEEMGMDRIDLHQLLDSPKAMIVILQAIVALEEIIASSATVPPLHQAYTTTSRYTRNELRTMASSILQLDCFQRGNYDLEITGLSRRTWSAQRALEKALRWG